MFKELFIENIKLKNEIKRLNEEIQNYKDKYETLEYNNIYENNDDDIFIYEKPFNSQEVVEKKLNTPDETIIIKYQNEQEIKTEDELIIPEIKTEDELIIPEVKTEDEIKNDEVKLEDEIKSNHKKPNKYVCKCKYNFICLKCRK